MHIRINTGHTVNVERVTREQLPKGLDGASDFTTFWIVKNDGTDRVFFYLAKGYTGGNGDQICAWYPRTKTLWHGYGTTLKSAIEGAAKDGWLYA